MTRPQSGGQRRVDKVLADDFLNELTDLPIEELRARRHEAEQEEADLSYLRRMLHGRMDIVRAEIERRATPGEGDLVSRLAEILADPTRTTRGAGRHITVQPSRVDEHRRQVEQAIADAVVSDVSNRSDEELVESLAALRVHEAEVSDVRRDVQQVADACAAELARRYREGLVSVDDVLARVQPPTPR
ncbi:MAG: aerial mycelium formation protein [Actinomycetes bacterium]